MTEHVIVTTTVDAAMAAQLTATILSARLAACVQRLPIESSYWWDGAIQHANETMLVIKTKACLANRLISFIKEQHPYETPEVVVTPITGGLPGYLDWIDEVTADG
jgi:periplasmic divalent cation tolerance protein